MAKYTVYIVKESSIIVEAESLTAAKNKYDWLVETGQLEPDHWVVDHEVKLFRASETAKVTPLIS